MSRLQQFSYFNSFPPEIQALVLSSCTSNDLICLRLTSKHFYNLLPEPQCRISFENSNGPSLEATDNDPLCGKLDLSNGWACRYQHRLECHKHSYATFFFRNMQEGKPTPPMKPKCRTNWRSLHCECYTKRTKLHYRLAAWMPKGLRYCGTCRKFTKRKAQHRGRCKLSNSPFTVCFSSANLQTLSGYHGKPKVRISKPNYWTHTSRNGAFGRKIWKKWFNNQAWNRMERRLNNTSYYGRAGTDRYEMRRIERKRVDTKEARDNKSVY
jgi:hypothetical protein